MAKSRDWYIIYLDKNPIGLGQSTSEEEVVTSMRQQLLGQHHEQLSATLLWQASDSDAIKAGLVANMTMLQSILALLQRRG